ncbi:MAG TPA: carboxypeptidase regulatory-like domain-containing protein [Candidatus Saccharimonadales bacterium]|nr:carboxypeptidase regulatory-like domain-containing protein [Candidatus Saccharimonadales bacterium]
MRVGRTARWITTAALVFVVGVIGAVANGAPRAQAEPTIHVTGLVTNQSGSGVANVAVTADTPGTTTVAYGPSTTASDGSYELDVEAGTYDLHFTPASGSGLNPVVQSNVTILADQTVNVQLANTPPPPPTTHVFSGNVQTAAGQPLSNLRINLGGGAGITNNGTPGHFSFSVLAGVYSNLVADTGMFTLAYPNSPYPNYPNAVRISAGSGAPSFDLTNNDVTQDLTMPAVTTLNVTVRDNAGNTVPAGKTVTATGVGSAGSTFALVPGGPSAFHVDTTASDAQTDSSGVAHLTVFGNVTFNAGQVCVNGVAGFASSFCSAASVNTNSGIASVTLTQPSPPTHTFSGVLRDASGNPVPGVTVKLGTNGSVRTNASGAFSFTVSPGVYSWGIQGGSGGTGPLNVPGLPQFFSFDSGTTTKLDLTNTDITTDIVLPAATTVTVLTKDANGNNAPNIPTHVNAYLPSYQPLPGNGSLTFGLSSYGDVNSNSSGSATITVFTNSDIAPGQACATYSVSPTHVCNDATANTGTGGTTITLTQQPPTPRYTFAGTLRDHSGNAVPNVTVELGDHAFMRTDASGHYSLTLDTGVYALQVFGGAATGPLNIAGLPQFFNFSGPNIDLTSANVTRDMELPQAATVTVTVKDESGTPLSGATVSAGGGMVNGFALFPSEPAVVFTSNGNSGQNTTGANGSAAITVFRSTTFAPGTICATLGAFHQCNAAELTTNTGDLSLIFQQQPATPAAPTNLQAASPAKQPLLSWTGVSGADHYDVYRDGVVIASPNVPGYTDTSAADGSHEYYVTAVNAGGTSGQSNHVTVLVDNTAPSIMYTVTPAPNAAGWNNSNVAVAFTCDDTGSGVASCVGNTTVTAETSGQVVNGTVTDNAGNTATAQVTVKLDKTLPTVGTFTVGSKTAAQTKAFTAPASDAGSVMSGVVNGEYYYGTDPGAGNGTPMTYNGTALSGSLGSGLPVGVYQIYVRSHDAAGNWSNTTSAQLIVTQTGTTSAQASGAYNPSVANGDQLPQLGSVNYAFAQYNMNVTFNSNRITNSSNASYTYNYGTSPLCAALPFTPGCHQTTFVAATFDSMVFTGTGIGNATITGTATVTVDGGTATTNRFKFTLSDGARTGGTDQYDLVIYDATNPTTVLYHAVNNNGTVRVQ